MTMNQTFTTLLYVDRMDHKATEVLVEHMAMKTPAEFQDLILEAIQAPAIRRQIILAILTWYQEQEKAAHAFQTEMIREDAKKKAAEARNEAKEKIPPMPRPVMPPDPTVHASQAARLAVEETKRQIAAREAQDPSTLPAPKEPKRPLEEKTTGDKYKVLVWFRQAPKQAFSVSHVADSLTMARYSAGRWIKLLEQSGNIVREGTGATTAYRYVKG